MDELYKFDGIFTYKNDGFYINQNNSNVFIKWKDIIEVNSFTIPVAYREEPVTGLEIITNYRVYELNNEFTPGIKKFVNELYNNFQIQQKDLKEVKINNYGHKKTNIYKLEFQN